MEKKKLSLYLTLIERGTECRINLRNERTLCLLFSLASGSVMLLSTCFLIWQQNAIIVLSINSMIYGKKEMGK